MKVAVLCDDRWHPANTVQTGLKALELTGIEYEFMQNDSAWSAERMSEYPVTILAKSNCRSANDPSPWLTQEVQLSFADYVEGGGGLFVVHSGTVGYKDAPMFRRLVGGVFTHHPPACEVILQLEPEARVAANAPLGPTAVIEDEHYFVELDDSLAEVFMTSESLHGRQPAGWIRRQGKGRVCVATPGHFPSVWQNPFYQMILQYGIGWCAGHEHRG
ncbi:ThuA domain-containing protein [Paenibacillus sp. H1-7]|uniref:ThuA domain-containing protein n=1 Tax=Paenibacillus sp. H1-7 TaxID=2282849 RepID=UPI001EF79C7B|nr:ThuA domain-containing protein [Paenibacillus sp. H1-7]